nr:hypothetical protein [Tanacetum cinerariifolium]
MSFVRWNRLRGCEGFMSCSSRVGFKYQQGFQPQICHLTPSVPQNAYNSPIISPQPQAEFPQLDLGLAVLIFLPRDDPIAGLNKEMAFMSTVVASRFPSTYNQLRTSSNPRNQATIQDDLRITDGQYTQPTIIHNDAFQIDDLDAYDSDCDDISSAKAALMANLSSYGSDVLSEVVKVRTTPDAITKGSGGFEHTKAVFKQEVIQFIKNLRDLFKDFDNGLQSEINEVKTFLTKWKLLLNSECSVDDVVVVRDFYKKFYNFLGRVTNHCSSSIGKNQRLLSFSRGIG